MISKAAADPPFKDDQRRPEPATSLVARVASAITSNLKVDPPTNGRRVYIVTEWTITVSLVMYAMFAPHSIAITQGSYLIGMVAWAVQLATTRKFGFRRTAVDVPLFGFFACCVVSSFLSYDPLVSVKGLKSPAFFLAFYFVSNKVRSVRFAGFLGLTLIVSCLVNVGYSGMKLARGRGLQIDSIKTDSPFANEAIAVGDVIIEADDQTINSREDLVRIIDSHRGRLRIKLQRKEAVTETSIPRNALREASGTGFERLGITTSPGRNFRVMGFYSHYETYAEVLALIAAVAVGMLIAIPNKSSRTAWFLGAAIALLVVTLILTSTRAPLAGLAISVAAMALASRSRRVVWAAIAAILIVLPLAVVAIERSRGISVLDPEEGSTAYRLEVWREALGMIKDNPLLGIGKGSEAKLKQSLGLYEGGKLPPGHFHSTPIQVAVWWGLLALIFYYSFMTIFAVKLWRLLTKVKSNPQWQLRAIALLGLGTVAAFNVSSLVHFNFGDGEVVMAFWLLTGLAFAVHQMALEAPGPATLENISASPSADSSDKSQPRLQAEASASTVRAARAKQN